MKLIEWQLVSGRQKVQAFVVPMIFDLGFISLFRKEGDTFTFLWFSVLILLDY